MSKPDLYQRFLNFMIAVHKKNSDMWVMRDTLKDYAFDAGYRSQTIWDAFDKIDDTVYIGKIFDKGVRYRYYDISKKDIEHLEGLIKWFDEL